MLRGLHMLLALYDKGGVPPRVGWCIGSLMAFRYPPSWFRGRCSAAIMRLEVIVVFIIGEMSGGVGMLSRVC